MGFCGFGVTRFWDPKQPVISTEIHVAAWLLLSSFGAPPNRIAPNICQCENSFYKHLMAYVYIYILWKSWGRQCEHVTCSKAFFSHCFGSQYVAMKPWWSARRQVLSSRPGTALSAAAQSLLRRGLGESQRISENVTRTSGCPQDVTREFPEWPRPSESREWDSALSWGCWK